MKFLSPQSAYTAFKMVKLFLLFALISFVFISLSCNKSAQQKVFTVGFSQCTMVNKWRQTMLDEMQREIAFHPEIKFIFKDANGNTSKQTKDIQELLMQK